MRNKLVTMLLSIGSILNFFTPVYAYATGLPKQSPVPGGVAVLSLPTHQSASETPVVRYQGKRTLVMRDPANEQNWLTVIGIALDAIVGVHHIEITTDTQKMQLPFTVQDKKYPIERLAISDRRKVDPLATDLPLIAAQLQETEHSYATWSNQPLADLNLKIPVQGRRSSIFGLTRIINDKPRSPHSGLDIAAVRGTQVVSAKEGRVINVGNYFFSGNIVFVDHGQGFITSYCHLDSIAVNKGQLVQTGDLIGTVGNTGRATGPHLHWSVSLNGIRVDPQLFLHGL